MTTATGKSLFLPRRADGPWSRPDTKHRMADEGCHQPGPISQGTPMSAMYGEFSLRGATAPTTTTYGTRPLISEEYDHKLNPYRFAPHAKAITMGEPYVHPSFGFLAKWAEPTQLLYYRGTHAPTPTTIFPGSQRNDLAAGALGSRRYVAPATLARIGLTTTTSSGGGADNHHKSSAAEDPRPGSVPSPRPAASSALRPVTTAASLGGPGSASFAPTKRAATGPLSASERTALAIRRNAAPPYSWTAWPSRATTHVLRQKDLGGTSTRVLCGHTAHRRQILAAMYPDVFSKSGKVIAGGAVFVPKQMTTNQAATTIQAHARGRFTRG